MSKGGWYLVGAIYLLLIPNSSVGQDNSIIWDNNLQLYDYKGIDNIPAGAQFRLKEQYVSFDTLERFYLSTSPLNKDLHKDLHKKEYTLTVDKAAIDSDYNYVLRLYEGKYRSWKDSGPTDKLTRLLPESLNYSDNVIIRKTHRVRDGYYLVGEYKKIYRREKFCPSEDVNYIEEGAVLSMNLFDLEEIRDYDLDISLNGGRIFTFDSLISSTDKYEQISEIKIHCKEVNFEIRSYFKKDRCRKPRYSEITELRKFFDFPFPAKAELRKF